MVYSPTGNTNGVTGTLLHKSRTPPTSWSELPLIVDGKIEQVYRYKDRLAVYYTKDNRLNLGLSNPDNTVTHITRILTLSVPVQWFTSANGHLAHKDFDALFVNVEYKVSTETRQELRCIRIKDDVLVGEVVVASIGDTYVQPRQKFALSDPEYGIMVMAGGTDETNQGTRSIVIHQKISDEGVFQRSSRFDASDVIAPGCDIVVLRDNQTPQSPLFDVCIIGGGISTTQYRSKQLYCIRFNSTNPSNTDNKKWYLDAWTCSSSKAVNGADKLGDSVYWIDTGMVGTLTSTGFGSSGVRFDQAWIKRYDLFRKAVFSVKRFDKRILDASLCVDLHGISIYPVKVNEYIPHSPFNWTYIPTTGKVIRTNHPDRLELTFPSEFKGLPRTIETNDVDESRSVERYGFDYDPQTNTLTLRYNYSAW